MKSISDFRVQKGSKREKHTPLKFEQKSKGIKLKKKVFYLLLMIFLLLIFRKFFVIKILNLYINFEKFKQIFINKIKHKNLFFYCRNNCFES